MHRHQFGIAHSRRIFPHILKQMVSGHGLPCMAHQIEEQTVLGWRQLDCLSIHPDLKEINLKAQSAYGELVDQRIKQSARHTAQQSPHARREFDDIERLRQIIIAACVQTLGHMLGQILRR
jgi:hypothetical protein